MQCKFQSLARRLMMPAGALSHTPHTRASSLSWSLVGAERLRASSHDLRFCSMVAQSTSSSVRRDCLLTSLPEIRERVWSLRPTQGPHEYHKLFWYPIVNVGKPPHQLTAILTIRISTGNSKSLMWRSHLTNGSGSKTLLPRGTSTTL